jgi:membrane fusion protein (multidrug efflux system)
MNAITEKPSPATITAESRVTEAEAPAPPVSTRAPAPPKRRLDRALKPALAVVVLIGAGVTASWWFTEGRWIESTDNAYVQGDISVLAPRIDGEVLAVDVADNQFVHAGDKLIDLDPADYQAKLAQAQASAVEAAAAVTTATRQIQQQRATIDAAQAMIEQAQAEQARASADAVRSASLTASGWASKQANDLAIADSRKSAAVLANAVAQKSASEQQLDVLQAQAAQAVARAQNAASSVKLAENALSYTVIRAPFDGVVGNRAVAPGTHVAAGTQMIAIAPPTGKLYVVANFKETQLRHMTPGMKVRLTPDIDPDGAVDGRVDSLAPATGALFSLLPPENATGNFTKVVQRVPVKIVVDPDQAAHAHWLRAGLSVTAEVDTRGEDAQRLGLFGAAAATVRRVLP